MIDMMEQRRVVPLAYTGYADFVPSEGNWFEGNLDAPCWMAAGSTIEIPADPMRGWGRLIADRLVMRP